jgi:hypothetical protein
MALDFSIEPFFDDYSEDKKFHRILFRPGYAVQARELTQMQTILQEQIRRHGDHIFKEGSMVIPGQISYDLALSYVKLTFAVGSTPTTILTSLVGREIVNSAGLIAKVITYTAQTDTDPNTIFVKYLNSVQDVAGNNISVFSPTDVLTPVDGTSGLDVTIADAVVGATPPIGLGCSATIQRGVYYIKKNFVLVTDQTIVLDKYTNIPSYRVGLQLSESIVYPEDDESLLDNALGTPNYSAPGAARYYIDLVLSTKSLATTEDAEFIELLRLNTGKVLFKIDRTQYAELNKTLARRTYDESGDYALSPFNMATLDFRNNLRGDWAASEKFIQGDLIKVPDGATGFYYFVAVTSGISGTTRPSGNNSFSPIRDSITDNDITWEYAIYPDFNRGVNTFTAGASEYAAFTINDHIRLNGMLSVSVEAGKAYVRGYEIEKVATEYVPIFKSRKLPEGSVALCTYFNVSSLPATTESVSVVNTTSIDLSSGAYVTCTDVKYLPDVTTFAKVNLHSVTYATAAAGNIIGTARIRGIERHPTTVNAYNVFLFDIVMNAKKDFTNVKSFYTVATAFSANAIQEASLTVLNNPSANGTSLIYQLPAYAVESVTEVDYTVVVPFTRSSNSGTTWEIDAASGYSFESVTSALTNYIVTNNATGAVVTPTLASTGSKLTLSGLTTGVNYSVLATMKRANVANGQTNFTVTDATPLQLTGAAFAQATTITLEQPFVTRIVSILMDNRGFTVSGAANTSPVYNTDITNRYTFNAGQETSQATKSSITRTASSAMPTGPIIIKYEYLALGATNPSGFLDVNSYIWGVGSKITYDQIFSVSNYSLRDCIDFRPIASSTNFIAKYLPKYGTTASIKYTHYLERIDCISLSTEGYYIVSKGIPSTSAFEPKHPNSTMKLASVSVEPYTFYRGEIMGAVISKTENKRYTMRDIGKLERRVQDLEYYTALSLSEMDTKNMRIVDANGFDRFQNGFLVDAFDGQGIGNTSSDDWNASIDSSKKELRPFFSQKQVTLLENVSATTRAYKVSGDLVTLPFTEVDMISQLKASMSENLNPYALYSWKGIVDINPWSDTWFSTSYRPDIVLNDEGQYNALVAKATADGVLGTVWNAWQVVFSSTKALSTRMENLGAWSTANTDILTSANNGGSFWRNRNTFTAEELDLIGNTNRNVGSAQANAVAGSRVLTIETSATETTSSKTGTRTFITDKIDSRIADDRVVDTQVVPYIRPRAVLFTGYGFKPTTNMYGFFDNTYVNDYITGATRLEITAITGYSQTFDVTRNAGSAVANVERTVFYSDGASIDGTVTLTNGSATVVGLATAFTQQVDVGDILNTGTAVKYKVTAITDNYTLTISPAYNATTASGASVKVIGTRHTTQEVEVAFNHGEVIKEYVGGTATGNTAIVVGQEVSGSKFYIYVMNIKGNGQFSTAANAYLEGEYLIAGVKPRTKFVARTDFTNLTTTESGLLLGLFRIPSNPQMKFRTGTRELRFSDDISTTPGIRASRESTSGGAFYEANGLIEIKQRTIIATRTASLVSTQVSDNNTIVTTNDRATRDTGWFDPLAQTFMVQQEGGAFITSVDLYFASADTKVPVRIEIREVVNGYPGSAVLPFSRVERKGSSIVTSATGTVASTFAFTSPVFLQNGVEYALVALSDSNNFKIHIAQTDTIGYDGVRISSQPYNGVLFKSQNASTWTADQTQDMKFVIRRAKFAQSPVTIELVPPKLGYTNLGFNPFNLIAGSKKCRVLHPNHGFVVGELAKFKTRQIVTSINGIAAANIFDINLPILSAELDAYVVEFTGSVVSTATGAVGGGYITAAENFEFETSMIEIAEVVPPGTSISYQTKVINHADIVSTYDMIPKQNTTFEEVKVYPSENNYISTSFPTGLSVVATLNPSSTLDSISPVIDLGRLAMTMVSNKIDSPDLSINDATLDYFVIATATEIGAAKPFQLVDLSGDTVLDTLVVNSLTQSTLYNHLNNNLNAGDVLQFMYSGVVGAAKNMTIVNKSQDSIGNLYFTLEAFNGSDVLTETTTGTTVSIWWLSHYKSEYSANGSSSHSKYVTKKINFSRPSDMLKIMFAAIVPNDAEVEIYYKTGMSVSGDFIASRYFKAVPKSGYTKSETEFSDITADVENLEPFDSVIIKLVMKSINKSKVPRIKNFRVISCAAA